MDNSFGREIGRRINTEKRSLSLLTGIVTGLLSDRDLSDRDILFIREWLHNNPISESSWPGNVLVSRIEAVLSDGKITEEERADLLKTLQAIIGGTLEYLSTSKTVTTLDLDEVDRIEFQGHEFCLTGDFAMGRKSACTEAIELRGGAVRNTVSKKIRYLIAGGLGSAEWKHGSFGTKIARAMQLKQEGVAILIVHEKVLARSLQAS